ncbi:MAG TPA: hypothetical protein VK981_01455 [Ramlibacter sp.]|nr:hypothetical protein [Ramlibacter sp.]
MNLGFPSILIIVISFVVTFLLARYLGKGWRERRAQKRADKALEGQSRQVRRARQRKNAPR